MVRQHLSSQIAEPEEGAPAAFTQGKLEPKSDATDQDVAAILRLPDNVFDNIPLYAVPVAEAPRKIGHLTPFRVLAACGLVLVAFLGILGAPLALHHTLSQPDLKGPLIAAVALSGNAPPPSAPLSEDDNAPDRPKNLELRLEKQPLPALAQATSTSLQTERDKGRELAEARSGRSFGSLKAKSTDIARAMQNSPSSGLVQHRFISDKAAGLRGFIDAKADLDQSERAERLEALDAIRLLRQK